VPHYSIHLSAMVIVLGASFVIAAADPQERLFTVKGEVDDEWGARIPQAEVVFKGKSGPIISHADMAGL
jgi:hypothetical protein